MGKKTTKCQRFCFGREVRCSKIIALVHIQVIFAYAQRPLGLCFLILHSLTPVRLRVWPAKDGTGSDNTKDLAFSSLYDAIEKCKHKNVAVAERPWLPRN